MPDDNGWLRSWTIHLCIRTNLIVNGHNLYFPILLLTICFFVFNLYPPVFKINGCNPQLSLVILMSLLTDFLFQLIHRAWRRWDSFHFMFLKKSFSERHRKMFTGLSTLRDNSFKSKHLSVYGFYDQWTGHPLPLIKTFSFFFCQPLVATSWMIFKKKNSVNKKQPIAKHWFHQLSQEISFVVGNLLHGILYIYHFQHHQIWRTKRFKEKQKKKEG